MGLRVPQKFCTATRRGSAIRIGLSLRRQSRPHSTTRSSSTTKRHTNASFVIVYAPIIAICLLSTAIFEAAIFITLYDAQAITKRPSTSQCAGIYTGIPIRPPPLSLRQDYKVTSASSTSRAQGLLHALLWRFPPLQDHYPRFSYRHPLLYGHHPAFTYRLHPLLSLPLCLLVQLVLFWKRKRNSSFS